MKRFIPTPLSISLLSMFSLLFLSHSVISQGYTISQAGSYNPLYDDPDFDYLDINTVSSSISIGFPFEFYGNTYTQLYASANGFVTFNNDFDSGSDGGGFIPSANTPNNLIAGIWTQFGSFDIGGNIDGTSFFPPAVEIYYETIGAAPNRQFYIGYYGVDDCYYNIDFQIILNEGTNIIEIMTDYWDEFSCYQTTQGIENANGSEATFIFDRNSDFWNASSDYVAFIPPVTTQDDAAVLNIAQTFCEGIQDVRTIVNNAGANDITSVDINWSWNGVVQTPTNFSGTLPPGQNNLFVLGQQTFTFGDSDTLVVWTSNPNGMTDPNPSNDTITNIFQPALQGTFTIGGSSPDYATFNDAVDALHDLGVCDSVTFKVRDGSYFEQIHLQYFPGTFNHSVVFQSESGDSSAVQLVHQATSFNTNYTVRLETARNIYFRHLTIQNTGTSYGRVFDLINGASFIHLENNQLIGRTTNSTSSSMAVINITGLGSGYKIENNLIQNGSSAIYHSGESDIDFYSGMSIRHNQIENFRYHGILLYNIESPVIQNNLIRGTTYSSEYGMAIINSGGDSIRIENNQLYLGSALRGIQLSNSTFGANAFVTNNMISIDGFNASQGIYLQDVDSLNVVFNSVLIENDDLDATAYFMQNATNLNVLNNIFSNAGNGLAFVTNLFSPSNQVDYNDLYSLGVSLSRLDQSTDVDFPTIASWRAASNWDANGLSVDPMFIDSSDLHVQQYLLNKKGTPVNNIAFDFEGDLRNITNPDIGADEFDGSPDDLAVTGLIAPGLDCSANQTVVVAVQNAGSNLIATYDVNWSLDGVPQSAANVNTTLDTLGGNGSDTAHISLGNINLVPGQSYQFQFWTSNPNGNTDSNPINDTLYLTYQLPLQGIISVGPINGEYSSLTDAVAALDSFGVCGPVTLELEDGVFEEQVTIPAIDGLSAINRLTITSASGDTASTKVQFDPGINANINYVIRIVEADFITISNLTFYNAGGIRCRQIHLDGQTEGLIFEGNHFLGRAYLNSSSELIYGIGKSGDLDLTVRNNRFSGGGAGVYIKGVSDENRVSNISIEGNRFNDQNVYGVFLEYVNDAVLDANEVSKDFVNQHNPYWVNWRNSGGQSVISNNVFSSETTTLGMFLTLMNKNNVTSKTSVFNNMFGNPNGNNCFVFSNSERLDFFYNSVNNLTTSAFGAAFRSSSSDTLNIKNNNLFASNAPAMSIAFETNSVSSNYNNILSNGATQVGTWMGSYTSLIDWQNASGQDLNSISVDPQYFADGDLHVYGDTLNGSGTPISGIIEDIDGDLRDAVSPDIGADEIFTNSLDIAIIDISPKMPFAQGNQNVELVLHNFGQTDITQATIDWNVNNTSQPAFNYAQNLPRGTFDTVTIGNVFFDYNLPYVIKAWTSAPNNSADENTNNDTIVTSNLYPAVSGTLTIAGSTPHFNSVLEAQEAMANGGIFNGATFNIRNGVYSEVLSFENEEHYACTTPVVFQSESGNAEDVKFINTNDDGVPLDLLGADGITFKNLSFETTSSTFANVIKIGGESHCNTFEGCILKGLSTTSTSGTHSVVYSPTDFDTANVFVNNEIINGSYGIFLQARFSSTYEEGNQIIDNQFSDQWYRSVYGRYQKSILMEGNFIDIVSASSGFIGLYLHQANQPFEIVKNRIDMDGVSGTGIYLSIVSGTSALKGLAANNMIVHGGSTTSYGIFVTSGTHLTLAHNSILTSSAASVAYPIRVQFLSTGTVDIFNNNLVNDSGGYALHLRANTDINQSNYNNLFTTGPNIAYRGGTDYADLAAWQTTGFGINSLSIDPEFISATDLHAQSAFLNEAATPLANVTEDIDGDLRDPLTPDIGADEFGLFSDDVGLLSINYPAQPFPSGEQIIYIKFINNGNDTLTTMQVDLTVNGDTLPTYQWSGLLASGATYDSLDVGLYDFLPDSIHQIKAWVSQPNGMTDGLAVNDTVEVDGLFPGLIGTYTIGGIEPDFENIKDAVRVLNLGGAAGPVTFNIRDGVYLDTLHIIDYPGSDCDNPVVFQSESLDASSVTITNLGLDYYPVFLDGADGVTFQYLTLQTVNPAFANVIRIGGGANCNSFHFNHILGSEVNTTSVNNACIYDISGVDNDNNYSSNLIENGSYGFYLQGSGNDLSGTVVHKNILENQYYRGIYIVTHNEATVTSNTLETNTSYSQPQAIYLNACDSMVVVSKNHIKEGFQFGLLVNGGISSVLSPSLVSNNFISVGSGGSCHGIEVVNSRNYRIYHNNVLNESTSPNFSTFNNALRVQGGLGLDIRNNIFASISTSAVAIQTVNNPAFIALDHNLYFGTSGTLGSWNGTNVSDLTALQNASGLDANSLSANPEYVSSTDLHVGLVLLNEAGDPAVNIEDDFDGDLRGNPSDIGADEFVPAASDDAGVFAFTGPIAPFADGNQMVQVAIKNFGGNALTSANIRWLVNGIEQTPFNWTGNLSPGQCDTTSVGMLDFQPYSKHDFILWTESPNGVLDSTNINDTLYIDDVYPALNGSYTLGGILPDFNLVSQFEKAINLGGIIGDVDIRIRNGIYESQLLISDFPRLTNTHQLLIESESRNASDVTLVRNFAGDNYTVSISGVGGVTLRHLTLESTVGRVVDIANGARNIKLDSNIINGKSEASASANFALIFSGSTSEDSVSVSNNLMKGGSYGVYSLGSNGDREQGWNVINNNLLDQDHMAIYMTFQEGLEIINNLIDAEEENQNYGIRLLECDGSLKINKNQILLSNSGSGIYLDRCNMPAFGLGLVQNNYIFMGGQYEYSAVEMRYCDRIEFYHNSIHVTNTHAKSYSMEVLSQFSSAYKIHNNTFSNIGGGMSFYSFYSTGYTSFDHNNFFTTGADLARVGGIFQDILSLKTTTNQNQNSISVDPIYLDQTSPKVVQVGLDGAADASIGVLEDYEGDVRSGSSPDIGADEFTPIPNDVAIVAIIAPETFCGLSNDEDVTIQIQNRGSVTQTGFEVGYAVNSGAWVTQNIGALSITPGQAENFTFSQSSDLSVVGDYYFSAYADLSTDSDMTNDTLENKLVRHTPALVEGVTNMLPADMAIDQENPITLSWGPAPNATVYDVFVWPANENQPNDPQITDIPQINTIYSNVVYGGQYNWQVVAKNDCDQMVSSAIQEFTIRSLPDLIVDTVIAPATAFSGQEIQVDWIVNNIGSGETQDQLWTDAVYLSQDATLNIGFDTYLGGVQNLTALPNGVQYSNSSSFTLPINVVGNYYLFVSTDRYNNLIEISNNNNSERSQMQTIIVQPPAPNLEVDLISPQQQVFSGEEISIIYRVKNNGTGSTDDASWWDRIILSSDPFNPLGFELENIQFTSELEPDSTYTNTVMATLPEGIQGVHYVYVVTDVYNQVFENFAEDNTERSDTVMVLLSPPPDLVIDSIQMPDTVSSGEDMNLTKIFVSNKGGGDADASYWLDELYLSKSPIYNTNFNTRILAQYHYAQVPSLGTYEVSQMTTIPFNAEGLYYVYAQTDKNDRVYEYTMEDNNIYQRPTQIFVAYPDLNVAPFDYPDSLIGDELFNIQLDVINQGVGHFTNRNWEVSLYASHNPVFDIDQAAYITQVAQNNSSMMSGDTLQMHFTTSLPPALFGDVYLHFVVDENDRIYEGSLDSNNIHTIMMHIHLDEGLIPDLQVQNITLPDTAVAGIYFPIDYNILNAGLSTVTENWVDKVFISFDPLWNPENAVELRTEAQDADLPVQQTRPNNLNLLLPSTTNENVYYIYISLDHDDAIYEGLSGEGNNIVRSAPIYIKGTPELDLSIDTLSHTSNIILSGQTTAISWTTTVDPGQTPENQIWNDRIYLSSDLALDTTEDLKVVDYSRTQIISQGESVMTSQGMFIPNGLSGDFYIIILSDVLEDLNDIDRSNNINYLRNNLGDPVLISITPAPTADLFVTDFNATTEFIRNAPLNFSLSIKNIGDASTVIPFRGQVYISTDEFINSGDYRLVYDVYEKLDADSTYTENYSVTIPSNFSGNYFLIVEIDRPDLIFENEGEGNNTIIRTIEVIDPPPSDLAVSNVTIPIEGVAGKPSTITWSTKNIGSFPADGQYREVVYLSSDTTWDVGDVVFGLVDEEIYIPPLSEATNSLTLPVRDVVVGDYYAIVQTDARDNLNESNEENNYGTSLNTMDVDVNTLIIDSLTTDTLLNGTELYYKINITPDLVGESMIISLSGDSLFGLNELYVKFDDIPSRSDFDFAFDIPFSGQQRLVIPSLEVGTYYILGYGVSTNNNTQPVDLLARIVPFDIFSVAPMQGVKDSSVTVEIKGIKLNTAQKYRLRISDPWFELEASSVFEFSENLIYATFDLTGVPVDTYTIEGVRLDSSLAWVQDGFKVIENGSSDMQIHVEAPTAVPRRTVPIKITINYTNAGEVDAQNPMVKITSAYGNILATSLEALYENNGVPELHIPLQEDNAPPGFIRPQGSGMIELFSWSSPTPVFIVGLKK